MATPASRTQAPEPKDISSTSPLSQAEIDAAHGTTGWNAYDVWRKRILQPQAQTVTRLRDTSHGD